MKALVTAKVYCGFQGGDADVVVRGACWASKRILARDEACMRQVADCRSRRAVWELAEYHVRLQQHLAPFLLTPLFMLFAQHRLRYFDHFYVLGGGW